MDEGLKKRLIGATVLVSLIVIFVPMLLEKESVISPGLEDNVIPDRPEMDFSSKVLPLETEDLSQPPPVEIESVEPAIQPVPEKEIVKEGSEVVTQPKPAAEEKSETTRRVGLSAWVVQVGSFSKRSNADKLVKRLQKEKYTAFTDQVDVKGKILHRVLVGPEIDKKLAEQMLVKLNKYLKAQNLKGRLKSYH